MFPDGPARGVNISGVPVGEARFVANHLACKVENMVSNIQTVSMKLRDRHSQALWSVAYYCLQPKLQYWAQHCTPAALAAAADTFDAAMLQTVHACAGCNIPDDSFALRRLRLPARMYGGGLRAIRDLAPAAFARAICQTIPRMADALGVVGAILPGFMPCLTRALGISIEAGATEIERLEAFARSGSSFGAAFQDACQLIQAEAPDAEEEPVRQILAAQAAQRRGVQRALTRWRELKRMQQLDVEIRALPASDMRRAAWLNVDRFSTTWVTAWPTEDLQLSSPEFQGVVTFYFGLPRPACSGRVGERIGNTRNVVDAHGVRLTTSILPGDGWRTQHDALKWRIIQDAKEMHVRMRPEVYGLFAASIPQAGRGGIDAMPARKRQGLVPDFLLWAAFDGPERPLLFELKTLHYGRTTYPQHDMARCGAVARRANALATEYATKAREVDRRFCGTVNGHVGPVETRLRAFEPVRGLVFGAWGEASPHVTKLLALAARTGAERHWRGMRCEEPSRAIGAIAWLLRRRWGLTALREAARLKLDRLEWAGAGAVAAGQRRQNAGFAFAARARAAAGTLRNGPRAR